MICISGDPEQHKKLLLGKFKQMGSAVAQVCARRNSADFSEVV